ncbi:MAG: hypothetical protein L0216_11860 [Planctomycetales bacterium]|nr:hypothetical protein [Planctomycetales bacterium]
MHERIRRGCAAMLGASLAVGSPGCGKKDEHVHGTGPGQHVHDQPALTEKDVKMPATFAEGVHHVEDLAAKIEAHAAGGTLGKVHRAAEEAKLVADRMADLAQKDVPAEKRAGAVAACRAVAAMFPDLDKAGDSGQKDETMKLAAKMKEHVASMRAAAGSVEMGAGSERPAGSGKAVDLVCGMEVDTGPGALTHRHDGKDYFF